MKNTCIRKGLGVERCRSTNVKVKLSCQYMLYLCVVKKDIDWILIAITFCYRFKIIDNKGEPFSTFTYTYSVSTTISIR